jgi:hypothetical protein
MLTRTILATGLIAAIALPTTEALALKTTSDHGARQKAFHVAYRQGYASGYRRGYRAANYQPVAVTSPADAIGAAALGAIYGYWSDGYRTYGGDPCYVYNDRDWDFQRVC